jgi:hypothetical protein
MRSDLNIGRAHPEGAPHRSYVDADRFLWQEPGSSAASTLDGARSQDARRVPVAKNQKKVAKKQSVQAGRTLAGRTLANPNSRVKDKKLAASVLSLAGQTKQKKKK